MRSTIKRLRASGSSRLPTVDVKRPGSPGDWNRSVLLTGGHAPTFEGDVARDKAGHRKFRQRLPQPGKSRCGLMLI